MFLFCVQICLKHFLLQEELSEIWSKMYVGLHVKCQLFLSDSNETWIFSTYFRKLPQYQIEWKLFQWEPSSSIRTYGQAWSWRSLFAVFRTSLKSALIRLRKHSAIRCNSRRIYGSLCTKFDHVNAPHNDAVMNLSQRTCGWNTNKCKAHFNSSFL